MKYIIIFTSLFFFGCSSTDNKINEYKSVAGSIKSTAIPISSLNGSPQLTLGQQTKGDIIKEDPMFLNEGYASNYDTYKMNISTPGEYNINVKALCDCLGFSKTLFFPSVRVLDKSMVEVPLNDSNIEAGMPTNNLIKANIPAHLDGNWTLIFPESGIYYLIISPYNKDITKTAIEISLPVSIKAHPYGKYIATVESTDEL